MKFQTGGMFFLLLFSVFTLSADFNAEFDGKTTVTHSKDQRISFRTENGISGVMVRKNFPSLKVTAGADGLVIDGSKEALTRKKPLIVRFFLPKQDQAKDVFRGKKLTSEVTVKADRSASGMILIEGRQNGKHYHKGKFVPVGTTL